MKLQTKILLQMSAVLILSMSIYSYVEYARQKKEITSATSQNYRLMLTNLFPGVSSATWNVDENVCFSNLLAILEDKNIKKMLVFGENLELLCGYEKKSAQLVKLSFAQTNMLLSKYAPKYISQKYSERFIDWLVPTDNVLPNNMVRLDGTIWNIMSDKRVVTGHIFLEYSTDFINKKVEAEIKKTVSWFFTVIAIILFLVFLFIKFSVLSPIKKIFFATQKISQNNYVLIEQLKTKDEFSNLIKQFNNMTTKVLENINNIKILSTASEQIAASLSLFELKEKIEQNFKQLLKNEDYKITLYYAGELILKKQIFFKYLNKEDEIEEVNLTSILKDDKVKKMEILNQNKDNNLLMLISFENDKVLSCDNDIFILLETLKFSIRSVLEKVIFINEQVSQERYKNEMETAKAVQEALFPTQMYFPNLDIYTIGKTADQTGGDWSGYYYDEKINVLYMFIGDVTGHGISAALITAVACGAVYSGHKMMTCMSNSDKQSQIEINLNNMAQILNQIILQTGREYRLMTMLFAAVNLEDGLLYALNAGHNAPLLLRKNNDEESMNVRNLSLLGNRLGFSIEADFSLKKYQLETNDYVFFYTDGLIENTSLGGDTLGMKKLKKILQHPYANPKDLIDGVLSETDAFLGHTKYQDDVTMLAIQWKGKETRQIVEDSVKKQKNNSLIAQISSQI